MSIMKFRKITQRGQVLALYGLLIPFLLLFVGVGLDLGWYYLNVSRLQNAADAAALAGAQALVEKEYAFEDYYVVSLASNALPEDFDDYENVFDNTFKGKLYNYKEKDDIADTLKNGRTYAEEYTRKNLSDAEAVDSSTDNKDTLSALDGWSISVKNDDKKVNGKIELKYKLVDGKNDVLGPLYYVVSLHEKIRHFFMGGWFEDMDAPVRAVVLLQPHDRNLVVGMQSLERKEVIDNWEYANRYKTDAYSGNWNHYMAGTSSDAVKYTSGNVYRTESVGVRPVKRSGSNGSDGQSTSANGGKFYNENEVDSINIDAQAEVRVKKPFFNTDWDLGLGAASKLSNFDNYAQTSNNSWGKGNGDDKRILFNIEFNESFEKRPTSKGAVDPLWVRIESDPIIWQKKIQDGKETDVTVYNSVRQFTLNFNADNSQVKGSGDNKYYEHRPYVIFYTGPENVDYATKDGVLIRHSQPVVVNLNEDTNAIMYFPENPVVLNGNGHKLTGFIIAKCFLFAVTSEDMTNGGTFEHYDGFNAPENVTGDFKEGTIKSADGSEYIVYFRDDAKSSDDKHFFTREELDEEYPDATIINDEIGNLIVKEMIQAPKYPVIHFNKGDYDNCKNLNEYFNATADYIRNNYTKAAYAQFAGIAESEVSMITFPLEGVTYDNFNLVEFPVATADLLTEDPDPNADVKKDKYVKVMLGEETRYIDKAKLPYAKIRFNAGAGANLPYVCLYDLKMGFDKLGTSTNLSG